MDIKKGKIKSISINGIVFNVNENNDEMNNFFNREIRPATEPISLVELSEKYDWKTDNSAWKKMINFMVKQCQI